MGIGTRLNRGVLNWSVSFGLLTGALVSLASLPAAEVAVESEALTAGTRVALVRLWAGGELLLVVG